MLLGQTSIAQPTHQPDVSYTNDGSCARVGHGSTFPAAGTGSSGFMQATMGGIAEHNGLHYLVQNVGHTDSKNIVFDKKNGTTGAPLGLSRFNIGQLVNGTLSSDRAWDIAMDVSMNRIYICGQSTTGTHKAYVMALSMTTMAPIWSFGNNGVLSVGTKNSVATGIQLTGTGNNFVVSVNAGNKIVLREYNLFGVPVMNGTISVINNSSYSTNATLKKGPNGHFFVAGSVKNGANVHFPMIWECQRNTGTNSYIVMNSTSPGGGSLGSGEFMDYDFYIDPSPANPGNYAFDIMAVGNNSSAGTGIFANYEIPAITSSYYSVNTAFHNSSSVPGNSLASNNSSTDIRFTRCLVNPDGYTNVLGYGLSSDALQLGYLNPTGTDYQTTYLAANGGNCTTIHKSTGMIHDGEGNLLLSGCATVSTYTIIKVSNFDCSPPLSLDGSSELLCEGQQGYLNINTESGYEILVQGYHGQIIHQGSNPVSVIINPTVTTTYTVTITDPLTGCQTVMTHTVFVYDNDASFSMSVNTSNSNYLTLSAIANDQAANSQSGFGYYWSVEEIDGSGSSIFQFSNPSCWWIPLSTPNVFNGIDCISNSYSGTTTISNCSVPNVGRFEYGKRYRITRATWSDNCPWDQYSMIIEVIQKGGKRIVNQIVDSDAPDLSGSKPSAFDPIASLEVYPNPNNGLFTVASSEGFGSDVLIFDMTGKMVQQLERPEGNELSVDLGTLTEGMYYIKVEINGQLQTEKVIIR
jgi:uncharacterized protein YceK